MGRRGTHFTAFTARIEQLEDRRVMSADPLVGGIEHHGFDEDASAVDQLLDQHTLGDPDFWIDPEDAASAVDYFQEIEQALTQAHNQTGWFNVKSNYGFTGRGQTVAVIDSGIAYDHFALGGGFGANYRVVGGWDFTEENDWNMYDEGPSGGHGTHVSGIVGGNAGSNTGVAPGVDFVGLRVFNDAGAGYFSWVESALQWVYQNRNSFENPITTVNLSLGVSSWNDAATVPAWANLEDEFAQLESVGIFIAVSAGNSFASYSTPGLSYPAASPYVVPVMSTDDNGLLSYYSQRMTNAIAAPGRNIVSTVPDYKGNDANTVADDFATMSGTSMAAPYVAGASVLIREAMQFVGMTGITQDMIFNHMMATADTLYDAATSLSYKRLNLQNAINALMSADDFGSTTGTSHNLGALSGSTSVNGAIGTISDADYFRFTAGASGNVTFNVTNSQQNMAASWQAYNAGGQTIATQNANSVTFAAVAGQTYTVRLTSTGGIGHYSFTATAASGPANASPVFTSANSKNIAENSTAVMTVTATDVDLPAQAITYSIVGGADQSRFAITSGGVLSFVTAPNYEAPVDANGDNVYAVTVQASDGAGGLTTQTINVSVTNVNDNNPFFTSATSKSVAENSTAVMGVTATDADLPAQAITFSISGGADQSRFAITSGGVLSFITAPNFEAPADANGDNVYVVTVRASDGAGGSTTQTISVSVTNVNDNNPLFTSANSKSVAENSTAVMAVTATDADLPAQTITYSIVGGADQSRFVITSGGVLSFVAAPNYEAPTDANGDNVYIVTVQASDGAGGLTIQTINVSVANVVEGDDVFTYQDWGTVSYNQFNDMSVNGDKWFRVQATRSGILSVQGQFNAGGGVNVELYDAAKQLISAGSTANGQTRADVTAVAGAEYFVRVSGSNSEVDFTVANLVSQLGSTVSVAGTSGDDIYSLGIGSDFSLHVNGLEYRFAWASATQFNLQGGDGNDSITIQGGAGAETATLQVGSVSFVGSGYAISGAGFETQTVQSGGGADVAYLYDSTGNDVFASWANRSTLSGTGFFSDARGFSRIKAISNAGGNDQSTLYDAAGDDVFIAGNLRVIMAGYGFWNEAEGFDQNIAYATAGGYDRVDFYDSAGNDQYTGWSDRVALVGTGYYNEGRGFERTKAYSAAGGVDVATFYDSVGNDVFIAGHLRSIIAGAGYYHEAEGFDQAIAYANAGGNDRVDFYDSPGDDVLTASPDRVTLTGTGFYNDARGFGRTFTYGGLGGYDVATFYDSIGNDDYRAWSTLATMAGAGYYNEVRNFDKTKAISTAGGYDLANFYDTIGNDLFIAGSLRGILTGYGYWNEAEGFDKTVANAAAGGYDRVDLYDSSGNDTLTGSKKSAAFSGLGFRHDLSGFDMVIAHMTAGGNDSVKVKATDYYFSQVGV